MRLNVLYKLSTLLIAKISVVYFSFRDAQDAASLRSKKHKSETSAAERLNYIACLLCMQHPVY